VLALAQRCGLSELVASKLTLPAQGGVNAHLKVPGLVGGMVAGADSIDDIDVLRHGGMNRLFGGVRAPSTLGTFLRSFTFGHVRQLDSVAAELLVELARRSPVLAGADQVGYVDIGDTVKAAAAGAVVLVGLPGAGPSRVAFTATAGQVAAGDLAVADKPWGTALHLRVRVPDAPSYVAWAVEASGHRTVAASWGRTPGGRMDVDGATALHGRSLISIVVTTGSGASLLTAQRT